MNWNLAHSNLFSHFLPVNICWTSSLKQITIILISVVVYSSHWCTWSDFWIWCCADGTLRTRRTAPGVYLWRLLDHILIELRYILHCYQIKHILPVAILTWFRPFSSLHCFHKRELCLKNWAGRDKLPHFMRSAMIVFAYFSVYYLVRRCSRILLKVIWISYAQDYHQRKILTGRSLADQYHQAAGASCLDTCIRGYSNASTEEKRLWGRQDARVACKYMYTCMLCSIIANWLIKHS